MSTTAYELLKKATPRPWKQAAHCPSYVHNENDTELVASCASASQPVNPANAALIVHMANTYEELLTKPKPQADDRADKLEEANRKMLAVIRYVQCHADRGLDGGNVHLQLNLIKTAARDLLAGLPKKNP